jgi:hypothetical protein
MKLQLCLLRFSPQPHSLTMLLGLTGFFVISDPLIAC